MNPTSSFQLPQGQFNNTSVNQQLQGTGLPGLNTSGNGNTPTAPSHSISVNITPTIPTSSPIPQAQNPTSNTSTAPSQSKQQMWQAAGNQGTPSVGWNGPASTPSVDFDSIYNPAFQALDNQTSTLNSDNQLFQGQISAQQAQQQGNLTAQSQQYENTMQNDENTLNDQKLSAYASAVKSASQMRNMYNAMYGGGSSAGPAAQQVLAGETEGTLGNIQTAYGQGLNTLLTNHSNYLLWMNQEKSSIDTQAEKAQTDLQAQFSQQLSQINQDRSLLESQKAQQKADLVAQTVNQVQTLRLNQQQLQQELASYDQNYQSQLQAQGQNLASQQAQFLSSNPFAGTNNIQTTVPTQSSQQSAIPGYLPQAQQQTDQYGNLIQA